jgi:hypothetical protein
MRNRSHTNPALTARQRHRDPEVDEARDPSIGARASDFFEIMRCVAPLLLDDDTTLDEATAQVRRAVDALAARAQLAGPLPQASRRQMDALVKAVNAFDVAALRQAAADVPLETVAMVHPVLEALIHDNFRHLEQTFGRDVAEDLFANALRSLVGPRRRGRPQAMPLGVVQRAKVLFDGGMSYGRIGQRLGYTGAQIRSALDHGYSIRTRR